MSKSIFSHFGACSWNKRAKSLNENVFVWFLSCGTISRLGSWVGSQKVSNLFSCRFVSLKDWLFWVKVIACSGNCFHLTLLHFFFSPMSHFNPSVHVAEQPQKEANGNNFKCNFKWQHRKQVFFLASKLHSFLFFKKHFQQTWKLQPTLLFV